MDFLIKPFSLFLEFLCELFQSYPIAIIVFTIIINVALIPFNIKQQKTMAKQARLKPKLDALKEKCGDDKMKYQNAMTELYQKENVSPAGGCLPMLIRLGIIMIVYWSLIDILHITTNEAGERVMEVSAQMRDYFYLFGIDLTKTPHFSTDIIGMIKKDLTWTIPILCFVSQFGSMLISNAQQKKANPQAAEMGGAMKGTMFIMPLMSLWITFSVTCALGFYWIISSIVNTIITLIVNKFYSADKINAKELLETGSNRRKREQSIINGVE
ncbi:MAG: YidC/Oxa1 family membrane protein insertase [Clostridia bacterium]|nr:YidC/Oxa1 family membrane protein insertase [Clostridia bacterium]